LQPDHYLALSGRSDMRVRVAVAVVVFATVVAGVGVSGAQQAVNPMIVRASVDTSGADSNEGSFSPAISIDGRSVAFTSLASDLVAGDSNGFADVFVRDLQTGATTRVSVDTAGGDSNGNSDHPVISGDGRYVAFDSVASDLVPGDGGAQDVFVRDLQAGTTTRVSVDSSGGDPDGDSNGAAMSTDGRYVAFTSGASDLVPGGGAGGVFVRDLQTGTTTRVSVDTAGGDPNGGSSSPSISADGRYVAFFSFASDLVPGDGGLQPDVFVRDLQAGTTTRVSVDATGGDADRDSFGPSISADGRYVAFSSFASDLVPGDSLQPPNVFVRDLQAGTTTRVSVDTTGGDSNGPSQGAAISADGRYVAFGSGASDLVAGDGDSWDIFVRGLQPGSTTRVSVDTTGTDPNGHSETPSISGDGRYVAFASFASDLVAGDGNGQRDVFRADTRPATPTALVCGPYQVQPAAGGYTATGWTGKVIVGTAGADALTGTSAAELILGLDGNDTIKGRGGRDVLCGNQGADVIDAAGGNDRVYGYEGADQITGGSGNDELYGGDGTDRLSGGDGADLVVGESGTADRCDGGPGLDRSGPGCERLISVP
jgi:Tol biopolymer transport system component